MTPVKKNSYAGLYFVSSIGINLVACTAAGLIIGVYLDKYFHTRYLTIIFLSLGIAAGFWQIIKDILKLNNVSKHKENNH
ncbi:MAG: AtpZ/AtpI family protein [Elusimicrobia bacterium]|nr:AtpZ/AtpI family protein [Elusimicrobiota bacterium]MBU2614977.1 AtpZ/AtpI family protein [Elusimicrobiota bacterium]